ncbi:MAG: glycosyltransferase family 2 protein [Promethearchaeota archaeon]
MKSIPINNNLNILLEKKQNNKEKKEYLFPNIKIAVIMPAYNEEKNIGRSLSLFPQNISNKLDIVIIDDGSSDKTCEIARAFNTIIIKHKKNKGYGAAIQTGLEFCRQNNYDIAIILDADGQHDPRDLYKFIEPIVTHGVDFVVGNRFRHYYNMKTFKKLMSRIMSIFYTILLQKKISDPTMGYRALSSRVFQNIRLESKYSISQEMLFKIIPRFKFKEVSTRIYEREYGESFIKTKTYLKKSIFSIIKFYLFPKFSKIFNTFLRNSEIRKKIVDWIET